MSKRAAQSQITQLQPEGNNEEDENDQEANNGSKLNPSLMSKREITKPKRPSERLSRIQQFSSLGGNNPFAKLSLPATTSVSQDTHAVAPASSTPPSSFAFSANTMQKASPYVSSSISTPSCANPTTSLFTSTLLSPQEQKLIKSDISDDSIYFSALNISLSRSIQKVLDTNSCADISELFTKYQNYRKEIENKTSISQSGKLSDSTLSKLPFSDTPKVINHNTTEHKSIESNESNVLFNSRNFGDKNSSSFSSSSISSLILPSTYSPIISDQKGISKNLINNPVDTPSNPNPFAFGSVNFNSTSNPSAFGSAFNFGSEKSNQSSIIPAPIQPFLFGSSASAAPDSEKNASDKTSMKPFSFSFGSASSVAPSSGFNFGILGSSTVTTPILTSIPNTPFLSNPFGTGSAINTAPSVFPTSSMSSNGSTATMSFNSLNCKPGKSNEDQINGYKGETAGETENNIDEENATEDQPPHITQVDPYIKGPGEEDERTEFAVRSKLYMFNDSDKKWIDYGVGSIRINVPTSATSCSKPRLLMRAEAGEKLMLNFNLFKNMNLKVGDKILTCLGYTLDGKLTKLLVRVKVMEDANALLSAIEKSTPENMI